jgi:membrane protein implicated in regulation of membrane protease activity
MVVLIVLLAVAVLVLLVVARTIRIVPQARAGVIERFGRYQRTLTPGLALVGQRALVLEQVDGSGGRVKIGGEEWTARPFLEGEPLLAGEQVEVAQIEGATALVLR